MTLGSTIFHPILFVLKCFKFMCLFVLKLVFFAVPNKRCIMFTTFKLAGWYYFEVVRFIFERGLWSGEGKSYAGTVV